MKRRTTMGFKFLKLITVILLIIGALNWGIIGISNFNVIEHLFGHLVLVTRIIYILIGLAGLFKIFLLVRR